MLRNDRRDGQRSYGEIVRSSSIVGGAQAVNVIVGMAQTKLVAVMIGPAGVGLVGVYQAAMGVLGTASGLGLGSSAVREVAAAYGTHDAATVARTVAVLRRACWATGVFGWALAVLLARPLSTWIFGTSEYALGLAILGSTLLIGSIAGGQGALLQGSRRVRDVAVLQVAVAAAGALLSIGVYLRLGVQGIVPALLLVSAARLALSWLMARRVPVAPVKVTWGEVTRESRRLVGLGIAFMWGGLLVAAVGLVTRAWIVRDLGIEANGLYQSAWTVSGLFAGFILQAMGADFYPRLSTVADDDAEVNRLVNEQTEVGVLLALPGLMGTLTLAPFVIQVFYSSRFAGAADLLPWFVLGVFGRVLSWPLGFIQQAKGATRVFAATETGAHALLLLLTWVGLAWWGIRGVAIAFAAMYSVYFVGIRLVAARLSRFEWSTSARTLMIRSILLISIAFAATQWLPPRALVAAGILLTVATGVGSLLGLSRRLGEEHRLTVILSRLQALIRRRRSVTVS